MKLNRIGNDLLGDSLCTVGRWRRLTILVSVHSQRSIGTWLREEVVVTPEDIRGSDELLAGLQQRVVTNVGRTALVIAIETQLARGPRVASFTSVKPGSNAGAAFARVLIQSDRSDTLVKVISRGRPEFRIGFLTCSPAT